ncbi:MAG TPA: hypothetical protein VEL80_05805 [Burkholderiales bacterium]|nr:hypothetical protein [Burkholderiales bacterium]
MRLGIAVPPRPAGHLQLHGPHHRSGRGMDVQLAVSVLDVALTVCNDTPSQSLTCE